VHELPFIAKDCIVDVVELPNLNDSAKFVVNKEYQNPENHVCHVVDSLPETGEVVSDSKLSKIIAYYNKTDNNAYGYVDSTLSSQIGVPAGWYPLIQLSEAKNVPYGGIITNITADPCDDKLRILVSFATGDINDDVTYRVLNGTFVHNMMLQNHCVCHIVEWVDGPEGVGEPVLSFSDSILGLIVNGYYNTTNNTVYGYFDDITIEELGYYIDSLDLNDLVKVALKAALKTTSKGWKTLEEVVELVGSATSMSWGGIIGDISEATNNDGLYLLLSSKYYYYRNSKWITSDNGIGMSGQFAGAEIFNDPHNIAIGKAAHAEGRETEASDDATHAEGYRTIASGKMSHAEGEESEAQGQSAHAEGYKTHANGQASHAEGTITWATGAHAHSEGYETKATGSASHAGGIRTEAAGDAQTVIGQNNVVDSTKAFIIGNGTSASTKSNAVTVDWSGNAEFKGTVTSNGAVLVTTNKLSDYAAGIYITAGRKTDSVAGIKSTAEGFNTVAS
jgi:hypothetical protein